MQHYWRTQRTSEFNSTKKIGVPESYTGREEKRWRGQKKMSRLRNLRQWTGLGAAKLIYTIPKEEQILKAYCSTGMEHFLESVVLYSNLEHFLLPFVLFEVLVLIAQISIFGDTWRHLYTPKKSKPDKNYSNNLKMSWILLEINRAYF